MNKEDPTPSDFSEVEFEFRVELCQSHYSTKRDYCLTVQAHLWLRTLGNVVSDELDYIFLGTMVSRSYTRNMKRYDHE